ncbi:unnamed protein product [Rotaria sordida]|uniref:BZIP domain-containing protein n=1 Tax=Rotaria sordida TaxID=392033 RepID=A0A814QJR4_9BILA|nr:unnamed protein product [Rotaria sordida]CAF1283138.1 unnamed protein product [Rotaria sordida]CAF1317313.1 unnamed protein product [Rotaria sordida]CAF1349543.1 unnamed protein product [Rotaria sordida]CAF1556666.1 unnamed protein product [Rotaria sordida]
MGTVGSSILSASGSTINDINNIHNQNLSTSNYEYRNETMPVIVDVMSIDSSKFKNSCRVSRTSPVIYGPICIKKRRSAAPTLATGRRSKDAIMEGEEARKREIRRMKNRISARNLKRLRDNIENNLKSQVKELETRQNDLLIQIENLHKYKQDLEEKYQQSNSLYEFIARTASTTLLEVEENQQQKLSPIHYYSMESKEEQNPPSPQWQLLFSI